MIAVRVLAFAVGLFLLQAVLRSAIRTVVVPRGEQVLITRVLFLCMRAVYSPLAERHHDAERRHAVLSRYAPMALVTLALVWALGIIAAFTPMLWAVSDLDIRNALRLSGSSITTLGFAPAPNTATTVLVVGEALLGLGVVALLITYLPTIYGSFSRRETEVLKLEVRAGSPPSPATFIMRLHAIDWTSRLGTIWEGWETWFEELEESHTSQPSLALFRSKRATSSWITTAGSVLDTIALAHSALDLPREPQAPLTLRAGFLALRSIASYYGLRTPEDPRPNDPISISRADFDELVEELELAGVPVRVDREQAWRDYAGWRVNYDEALLGLCALVGAPEARWSSDRSARFHRPLLRTGMKWRVDLLDAPDSW